MNEVKKTSSAQQLFSLLAEHILIDDSELNKLESSVPSLLTSSAYACVRINDGFQDVIRITVNSTGLKETPYATFKVEYGVDAPDDTICYLPVSGDLAVQYASYVSGADSKPLCFMGMLLSSVYEHLVKTFLDFEMSACVIAYGETADGFLLAFYYKNNKYQYLIDKKFV